MLGVGPGLLPSDAFAMGIEPATQRDRMVESIDIILRLFAGGVLGLCLVVVRVATAQVQATDKPFLWRIEGPTPSYLFGTIHVPDARVLAIPDVVRRAFDASDVFNGELPLDDATRQSADALFRLPQGQTLRTLLGDEAIAAALVAVQK